MGNPSGTRSESMENSIKHIWESIRDLIKNLTKESNWKSIQHPFKINGESNQTHFQIEIHPKPFQDQWSITAKPFQTQRRILRATSNSMWTPCNVLPNPMENRSKTFRNQWGISPYKGNWEPLPNPFSNSIGNLIKSISKSIHWESFRNGIENATKSIENEANQVFDGCVCICVCRTHHGHIFSSPKAKLI